MRRHTSPGRSTSNYEVNNRDHDGGNTWNTTCISSAGTAALAQSDPSPRRHPARQTTVRSRPPRRRVRPDRLLSPINMIANAGTQCNYLSPEGVLCGVTQSTGGSLAKHWLLHAMREIVRIEGGEMEMSHATIINTEARMLVASRFRTPCPHSRCRKRASYYRPEGLADHLTTCSAGPGIPPPSYEVAKQVAHELMAELVRYDQEVFRSLGCHRPSIR
ncbi:hypothetical protein JB92DRAFT_1664419 [Gautieria morchelliformis]|nr:hypothetical protein JB92DRAFT_1664419 [Gautieria morchelliformis]